MLRILGDNPFFGVNHSGKGDELYKGRDFRMAAEVIQTAAACDFEIFMLSPHDEAESLLEMFGINSFPMQICAVWPYPHSINRQIAEMGYRRFLARHLNLRSGIEILQLAVASVVPARQFSFKRVFVSLIESELERFSKFGEVKYVALHNIVTDLILASDRQSLLFDFRDACGILQKTPVLITQNVSFALSSPHMPKNVIVCSSINPKSYMMDRPFDQVARLLPSGCQQRQPKVWGMQIMASGANTLRDVIGSGMLNKLNGVVYATTKPSRVIEFSDAIKRCL